MNQSRPDPATTSPPTRRDRRADRRAQRLQSRVGEERIVDWTRGWVSREVSLHGLLAARTLDFAVLTDRSLVLVSTGFFTRRPRRCVYSARLDQIFVSLESVSQGRRLRITSRGAHAMWIELGASNHEKAFASALVARSRAEQP